MKINKLEIIFICSVAAAAIFLFAFHNAPLGVVTALATLPLVSWVFGEPLPFTLGFSVIFLLSVIRRLTAPRTSLTASVSLRQLIVNRLLFDRDIRNREAWIRRTPIERALTE